MRLLFIIDSLSSGGAQRQMINLALGLDRRGHDVSFFVYMPGSLLAAPLEATRITVNRYPKKRRYSPAVLAALRNEMQSGHYDVALSFMATPNFYNILASRLVFPRPKVVISERFYDPPNGLPWREEMVRQLYRWADYLVVNSQHQYDNLLKKHAWLEPRAQMIHNGLDLELFRPPEEEPPTFPLKLIGIAHLSPYKNQLCLVKALKILSENYGIRPQVNWVGAHPTEDYPSRYSYAQTVYRAIDEYALGEQWHWLYEKTDIPEMLQQHHALVHPSYGEGFPNVVCEALASGRPVVVSDVLDHPHLVQSGETGFLFDSERPEDLAEKIRLLYNLSEDERRKMSLQAREFAKNHLSVERLVNQYETLFQDLIAKN